MSKRCSEKISLSENVLFKRMKCDSDVEVSALHNLLSLKHLPTGDLTSFDLEDDSLSGKEQMAENEELIYKPHRLSDTSETMSTISTIVEMDPRCGIDMRGTVWTRDEERNLLDLIRTFRITSPFARKTWVNFAAKRIDLFNGRSVESFYRRSLKMRAEICEILKHEKFGLNSMSPVDSGNLNSNRGKSIVPRYPASKDVDNTKKFKKSGSLSVSGAEKSESSRMQEQEQKVGKRDKLFVPRAHSTWTAIEETNILQLIEKYHIRNPFQRKAWEEFESVYGSESLNGRSVSAVSHRVEKMKDRVTAILTKLKTQDRSTNNLKSSGIALNENNQSLNINNSININNNTNNSVEKIPSSYYTNSCTMVAGSSSAANNQTMVSHSYYSKMPRSIFSWVTEEVEEISQIILFKKDHNILDPFDLGCWLRFYRPNSSNDTMFPHIFKKQYAPSYLHAWCMVVQDNIVDVIRAIVLSRRCKIKNTWTIPMKYEEIIRLFQKYKMTNPFLKENWTKIYLLEHMLE